MKILFSILLLIGSAQAQLLVMGKQPGWVLLHETLCSSVSCAGGPGTCSATASSCTITIPSTTAGSAYVVWTATGALARTIGTITGGDTFTACGTNCQASQSSAGSIDAKYVLSGAGGKTSLVVPLSGASTNYFAVWVAEYSHTNTASFDVANKATSAGCTSCAAPTLTLTGTNDLIMEFALPGDTITAINDATYNKPAAFTDGLGRAAAVNKSSYTAPTWTQNTSSAAALGALALKQ